MFLGPFNALRFAFAAFALFIMVSGTASAAKSVPPLPALQGIEYRLDAGDELRISVFGLDAITNTYTVSDNGNISLPLIEDVMATGRTVAELQSAIAAKLLERQIVNAPNINVQVTKTRPFYVLGEVKKPGEYSYRPGMTVLTAISVAGGYTFRANTKRLIISRRIGAKTVTGSVKEDALIQPGDTIRINESWF